MKGIAPILVLIVLLLVAGGTAATYVYLDTLAVSDDFIIDGNTVYVNDENLYLSATPHTIYSSQEVIFELVSKHFTGEADIMFGFDYPATKPITAEYYNPRNISEQKSYTCDGDYWFNYTLNPKHFYCWNTIDESDNVDEQYYGDHLMFDHEFESANMDTATAYWTETHQEDWSNIASIFDYTDYEYGGMTRWYHTTVDVVAEQKYTMKSFIEIPVTSDANSKYWVCIKPHSESIAQAQSSGHLYCLDPWWNSGWAYYTNFTITENSGADLTNYQVGLEVNTSLLTNFYCGGERFVNSTNDEIDFYRQIDCADYTAGQNVTFWVEVPVIPSGSTETVYMYYGNTSPVADSSNGNTTFIFYDGGEFGGTKFTDTVGTLTLDVNTTRHFVADNSIRMFDYSSSYIYAYSDTVGTLGTSQSEIFFNMDDVTDNFDFINNQVSGVDWSKVSSQVKIASDKLQYQDAGGVKDCGVTPLSNNVWYKLNVKYNYTNHTFDMYLNDTWRCQAAYRNNVNTYSYVQIATSGANSGYTVFLDDVVTRKWSNPEPTYVAGSEANSGNPPQLTSSSPTNTTYYVRDIPFNVSSDLDISYCGYSLDGAANVTMSNTSMTNFYSDGNDLTIGEHNIVYSCNATSGLWNQTSALYFTTDYGIIMVNSAQNSATRQIGDVYSTNISVGAYTGVNLGNVLIEFNSTNQTATQIDSFTQGSYSGGVYNYNVTLGAGDVGSHTIKQFASNLNDSVNETNATQYLSLTVNKWSNNTVTMTATPDWSIEYGDTATISCSADDGTPTIYKDGIGVANPYSAVLDTGSYDFNCTVPESDYYYQAEDTDTLTVGDTSGGCTNSTTWIYTANIIGGASVVKLNFSEYVDTHIVRDNLGDVDLMTSNVTMYTNFTGGEFIILNTTNVSSAVINFGNYYINTPVANTTNTNATLYSFTPSSSATYYTLTTVRDEMTLDTELPPNITSSRVTLYCTGGSQEFNVTHEYFALPTFRKLEQMELTARYSATELYFRDLLYDSNVEYRTFYMADAVEYQVSQYVMNLQDNTYDYDDAEIHIKKLIGSDYVTITEMPFDIENKAIVYLISGQQYQVSVTSGDGQYETVVGNLQADTVNLEKTIVLTNVTTTDVADANVSYALNYDNTTGVISFNWRDNGENTILTEMYVYNHSGSNTTLMYYVNSTNASYVTYSYTVPNLDQEYKINIKVHHSILGENTLDVTKIVGAIIGWAGDVVASMSDLQLELICSIFLIILILAFSPVHAGTGAVLVSIVGAVLTYVGIYPANSVVVSIAVVIAVLNKIIDRKVVT